MYLIIVFLVIVLILYTIQNNKKEPMIIYYQNDDDCNLGQYCNQNGNQSNCLDYECTYIDGTKGNLDDFLYDANNTESKCKRCSLEDKIIIIVSNWINVVKNIVII